MRLTQKNDFFEYVLPCQNVVGDNQATEISLGETEYTCKKYIIGEAINKLGEIEDVLEEFELTSAEDLRNYLNFKTNMAIWEGELNYKNKIACLEQELNDLQHRLEVAEKALELACSHIPCKTCPNSNGAGICYIAQDIGYYQPKENCNIDNSYYFKLKAEKEMKGE